MPKSFALALNHHMVGQLAGPGDFPLPATPKPIDLSLIEFEREPRNGEKTFIEGFWFDATWYDLLSQASTEAQMREVARHMSLEQLSHDFATVSYQDDVSTISQATRNTVIKVVEEELTGRKSTSQLPPRGLLDPDYVPPTKRQRSNEAPEPEITTERDIIL